MSAHPTGQAALPASNLWEAALQDLEPEEREIIRKHTQDTKPTDVLQIAEKKGQDAWNNRISFKRKSGELVFLHDIFAKVARWVKKFVEVGDAAVQYDPAHAALPWAAVRFILQASINDIQRQAAVLESVEDVAQAIPFGAIHECLYLADPSSAAGPLKAHLTKLYTLCWSSLANALRHHEQTRMKRVLKNVLDLDSDLSSLSKSIANQWAIVERSATLVRAERLMSHIANSQSRSEDLFRIMEDIKTPVSRIEMYVEQTQQTLDEMKRDRILDLISTIPYRQHQTKVNRNVLPGTGMWLLDHQVVRNWFSSSASEILWLHGIPGSGKSSLVSIIVEKLISESTLNPSSHPVYFYCNRNPAEKERADPAHILRSLLKQLSMPSSAKALPTSVMDRFNEQPSMSLDLHDTLDLIIAIIESRTITYIVLDALDECDVRLRDDLTDALETILQRSQSLVKIFVSSRNDADLVCWLREYPNKEILSSDNKLDLAAFIDNEVDRRVDGRPRRLLRARKVSDSLRHEIKQTLKAEAQGMFRWAELQLQYLCKLVTENDIRQRLRALPQSLMDTYHEIYQSNMLELRNDNPQYELDAKKVFHLMLSSHKPWDPIDMANMLEPAENAMHRGPEKVFRVTFHLITHDKELNVLRFAHLSVREYFETKTSEFTPPRNMEANVEACLAYLEKTREFGFRPLSYPSLWWFGNVRKLAIGDISAQFVNRLVDFVVRDVRTLESWLEEVTGNESIPLHGDEYIMRPHSLLSEDATMVFIACALGFENILLRLIDAEPRCIHAKNLRGESTLVTACKWAHNTNIVSLLLRNDVAINRQVGHREVSTALAYAICRSDRSIAFVKELLNNGADPNCLYNGRSALLKAVSRGHVEAVELLLKYGADPNFTSNFYNITPLYAACSEKTGPCEIVRKLLEAGARIKSVGDVQKDALQASAQSGREDYVTTLLSFGADVNALDAQRAVNKKCISALFSAINSGAKQIAFQLLSHGADPIPLNDEEHAIFERLLLSGDTDLAKALVSAPGQIRHATTTIQAARFLGEDEVMAELKILEEKKPNEQELCNAIDLAAERGLIKVFKRLVDRAYGCSLLYISACGPLAGTARRGQVEMFKTLWTSLLRNRDEFTVSLHTVPKPGSRTRFSSLLYEAATGGSTDIFHLILTDGALPTMDQNRGPDEFPGAMISPATTSIVATDKDESFTNEIRRHGAWYLHAAVKAGHADMVDLLLRLSADANAIAPDCHGQNALCTALIERKGPDIIMSLLRGGVDVNARLTTTSIHPTQYGTALAMALLRKVNHEEISATVIELILQHGADANASDDTHGSILQLAVSEMQLPAVELLLAHGADVNKGGGTYGSPLIAALALAHSRSARKELIELLLDYGADVNAQHPGEYQTAFRAALSKPSSGSFDQQIFQLFLAHNADVSAVGRDGTQALYVACASGACDELRAEFLLSHGADVNATGGEYGNPLQAACATRCPSTVVGLLIDKGAKVNAKGGRFGNALQAASYAGSHRTMEILLANGADVHANDGEYGYALQAAAMSFNPARTLTLLLSYGASTNSCGGKYGTAIQAACSHPDWSELQPAIRLLLKMGADLNVRGGEYGYALICAIAVKDYCSTFTAELVSLILDGGADINCSHEVYGNALYAACERSMESVMKILIQRGISVTQLAGEHEHALFVACQETKDGRKDDERVRVLLENGVDVNIRGKRYSCALEVAIKAGNLAAAKLLIEKGADVHVKTVKDGSLLGLAFRLSSREMVDLLRSHGEAVCTRKHTNKSLQRNRLLPAKDRRHSRF